VWLDVWYHKPLGVHVGGASTRPEAIGEALARAEDELDLCDGLPELVDITAGRIEEL
jgi:hypothetical protein